MNEHPPAGFEEVPHTADLELHVWGEDLPSLFRQAVRGMYQLLDIQEDSRGEEAFHRNLSLEAMDEEGLLVRLLEELLYLAAEEGQAFRIDSLTISPDWTLRASLSGRQIAGFRRDIKAVTYHNLEIFSTEDGREVNIVFDI